MIYSPAFPEFSAWTLEASRRRAGLSRVSARTPSPDRKLRIVDASFMDMVLSDTKSLSTMSINVASTTFGSYAVEVGKTTSRKVLGGGRGGRGATIRSGEGV